MPNLMNSNSYSVEFSELLDFNISYKCKLDRKQAQHFDLIMIKLIGSLNLHFCLRINIMLFLYN